MVYTVSIRDTNVLEIALKRGIYFDYPDEIKNNHIVINGLLSLADRVLPKFGNLKGNEVNRMAATVAYLMRPDLLISDRFLIGPQQYYPDSEPIEKYGVEIHLNNDPSNLNEEWKPFWLGNYNEICDCYANRAAELLRCYSAALSWIPAIPDKLDEKSLAPAFRLADMTAYLLTPSDLTQYSYDEEEIDNFNRKLEKEMSKI